jgi:TetR/AcrR family transcriptional regulator, ethionamide resistance regulator
MLPAPSRNVRSRRAQRRDLMLSELMDGVERLLEAGARYTDLPVDTIVKESGVARSTFYNYFNEKNELLLALFERVVAELTDASEPWWTLPPQTTHDDLKAALRHVIDRFRSRRALWGAAVEGAAYDEEIRAGFNEVMSSAIRSMTDHIRESQKQGKARPDRDAERLAAWLVWMMERGMYQLIGPADDEEVERLLETLTHIYWDSLYEGYR